VHPWTARCRCCTHAAPRALKAAANSSRERTGAGAASDRAGASAQVRVCKPGTPPQARVPPRTSMWCTATWRCGASRTRCLAARARVGRRGGSGAVLSAAVLRRLHTLARKRVPYQQRHALGGRGGGGSVGRAPGGAAPQAGHGQAAASGASTGQQRLRQGRGSAAGAPARACVAAPPEDGGRW